MRKGAAIILLLVAAAAAKAQPGQWTLDDCIAHALENNSSIRQQIIETRIMSNNLSQSKLKLLPSLSGSAAYNTAFGRILDETTYDFYDNEQVTSGSLYAGSSLTLFGGLVSYNRILRSRYELEAAESILGMLRNEVTLNVIHNYLQVVLSKELIAVTEAQVDATRRQAVNIAAMADAGKLTRGTLLDIEAQAAREEFHLVSMQNQYHIALLNLAHLLGIDTAGGFDIAAPEPDSGAGISLPPDAGEVYTAALSWWPALSKADAGLAIAGADLKIARGQQSPRLSVSTAFSTGFADTRQRLLNNDPASPVYGFYPPADQMADNIRYGIGFNLAVPVLNGWQTRNDIRNSRLALAQQAIAAEEARRELLRAITLAWTDAQAALKRSEAAARSAAAAREAFMYAEQRFAAGDLTAADYNTAKTFLLAARSEELQSRYEYRFRQKVLEFYRGTSTASDNSR